MRWVYDRYGNRPAQTETGSAPTKSVSISGTKNRITTSGYSYDLAGNMTAEPGWTYRYDVASRIKTVNNTSGLVGTYTCDGDGRRVKKVTPAKTLYYFYDPEGSPVWEYNSTAGYWETFNFSSTEQLASNRAATSSVLLWLHSDHLGSTRIKTKPDGLVLKNGAVTIYDTYYPFGEQINTPQDNIKYCFTRKERDAESGLDYFGARYHANYLGRFTSVNPARESVDAENPQTWNRYSYTLNNPKVRWDFPWLHRLEPEELY